MKNFFRKTRGFPEEQQVTIACESALFELYEKYSSLEELVQLIEKKLISPLLMQSKMLNVLLAETKDSTSYSISMELPPTMEVDNTQGDENTVHRLSNQLFNILNLVKEEKKAGSLHIHVGQTELTLKYISERFEALKNSLAETLTSESLSFEKLSDAYWAN